MSQSDLTQALRKRLALNEQHAADKFRDCAWDFRAIQDGPDYDEFRILIQRIAMVAATHENLRLAPLHELLLRVVEAAENVVNSRCRSDQVTAISKQGNALADLREAVGKGEWKESGQTGKLE